METILPPEAIVDLAMEKGGGMTKEELIKHICNNYHDVMTVTHDELLECPKKQLEHYLAYLQDRKNENEKEMK